MFLLAAAVGCDRQDTDRLSRLGRKVAEKGKTLSLAGVPALKQTLPTLRVVADPVAAGVETRIRARLQTDQSLAGVEIEVTAVGGQVELAGKGLTLAQRRRAVDLAQTTVGVSGPVVDKMEEKRD
jgi:hypothetical protein